MAALCPSATDLGHVVSNNQATLPFHMVFVILTHNCRYFNDLKVLNDLSNYSTVWWCSHIVSWLFFMVCLIDSRTSQSVCHKQWRLFRAVPVQWGGTSLPVFTRTQSQRYSLRWLVLLLDTTKHNIINPENCNSDKYLDIFKDIFYPSFRDVSAQTHIVLLTIWHHPSKASHFVASECRFPTDLPLLLHCFNEPQRSRAVHTFVANNASSTSAFSRPTETIQAVTVWHATLCGLLRDVFAGHSDHYGNDSWSGLSCFLGPSEF